MNATLDEITIFEFDTILKTGDWTKLYSTENDWASVYDSFIELYGINEHYKSYLMYMIEAINLFNEAYTSGRRDLVTMGEIRIQQAEALNGGEANSDLFDTCLMLGKHFGFRVNPKEITAREYFSALKTHERNIKQANETNN